MLSEAALRALLTGSVPAGESISEHNAKPSALAARMSSRPLRTNAAAPVIASRMCCTLGRIGCLAARLRGGVTLGCAARARSKRCARSASSRRNARESASSTLSDTPCTSPRSSRV
jgi:hypothetical protein